MKDFLLELLNIPNMGNMSYLKALNHINELLDCLPKRTEGLESFLGGAGWGTVYQQNKLPYNRRSAFVTGELILTNKNKIKTATLAHFERKTTYKNVNSVTDLYLQIGNDIYFIETKAGEEFFTFATTTNNNFHTQFYTMLGNADKVQNVRIMLNSNVRANLTSNPAEFSKAKAKVIEVMKKYDNGAIINDNVIRDKFAIYFGSQNLSQEDLLQLLNKNNNWFNDIFLNTQL